MPPGFKGAGYDKADDQNVNNDLFLKNRGDIVTRCIEAGMNYVDACSPQEILAYAKVVKSAGQDLLRLLLHTREPRFKEWRDPRNWSRLRGGPEGSRPHPRRPVAHFAAHGGHRDVGELKWVEESTVQALAMARQKGSARFTGVSSHNRIWLKSIIEEYPNDIQVVLFPYTANSKELPDDSVSTR